MAHPARPSESRKAQHHPAVVLAVVVVVTVETIVAVCCTLIPPAFQQTQSPTFTNGGGSCRWHGSFSIGWLGAKHFQIFGWFLRWTNNNKCRINCWDKWNNQKTQTHWKRDDDANGTKARCQLTANRFPAIGCLYLLSLDVALLALPLFSSLLQVLLPSYPPMSTRTHSIYSSLAACHPSFFTWTLRCFMAFPFTHTHTQRT